jgi:hypothetical protein
MNQGGFMVNDNVQSPAERKESDPMFKEVMGFRFGILNVPIETQVEKSAPARR